MSFISFMKSRFIKSEEEVYIEKEDNKETFNNILKFADAVLKKYEDTKEHRDGIDAGEHPLIDVIRVLGRKLQTEYLTYLLFSNGIDEKADIRASEVMFSLYDVFADYETIADKLLVELEVKKEVNLCKDVILPWPWSRERLIDNIAGIGEGRLKGKWIQHDNNHNAILWLPIGITWIGGGNHSISTGIIQGDGIIKPRITYDISPVYQYIYCDGEYYKRKCDDSIISAVTNIEFAAIFEVGRIMVENNISF